MSVRSRLGLKGEESSSPVGFDPREKGLAWAPPGLPAHKVANILFATQFLFNLAPYILRSITSKLVSCSRCVALFDLIALIQ